MLFLGTAAAEQFPNPFCSCETCQRTRSSGDSRDFRRRSSFRLDEETLIDFNADTLFASSQYRSPLTGLQNLFVTHMHEDHFDYWNMEFLNMSVTPCKPLQVYLSPEAAEGFSEACRLLRKAPFDQMREQFFRMEKVYELHPLPFYETVKVGEMLATPMRGRHEGFFNGEHSANFVFERPSGNVMYASDTGRFYGETLEWLQNRHLDVLVIEGSFGLMEAPYDCGHMTLQSLTETLEALYGQGTLDQSSRVYVTHIAHKGDLLHGEYERLLQERFGKQVMLAYDGLEIPETK